MAEQTFEERYQSELMNLEYAIVSVFRKSPALIDAEVDSAMEALVSRYSAEATGRAARTVTLDGARQAVFDAVAPVCEWLLGRAPVDTPDPPPDEILGLDVLVACLKRIRKSLQRWTKHAGRQGYLAFVSRFLP
jgi:hypothetical protein